MTTIANLTPPRNAEAVSLPAVGSVNQTTELLAACRHLLATRIKVTSALFYVRTTDMKGVVDAVARADAGEVEEPERWDGLS
jgi:hypothetical protein